MKHTKGANKEAAIKREKRKAYAQHWTAARSHGWHGMAFAIPMSRKSVKRQRRKEKLEATYQAFFANPENLAKVREIKFEWGIGLIRRMVRDTVLGSAAQNETKA